MFSEEDNKSSSLDGIAIVGMSGRFPKAESISAFWNNLVHGKDCIENVSLDDARKAGVAEAVLKNPRYVRRGGRVSHPDTFDAAFFGYSPREASFIDPQHRILLECGWEAMESAGYDVNRLNHNVGVFAGCGMNYYMLHNLINSVNDGASVNELQLIFASDKDFLTTRLSYKLNLQGPSFDIQTACSTSLVAIHVACQNLLTYQCDMALAGGVFLYIPWWYGYVLADGDIRSPDGICRPFDFKANGTLFGEGAGVVVLKRLEDAINDRDSIIAVVKSSAINNDGSLKAGFTAPSVDGQADVITMALETAGVGAEDISYVETHGTGTPLGDPIEISALTKAFRQYTNKMNYCGIGSVKASIGHLDAAAGVAGFIKTALALQNKKIPATINFTKPNPLLEIEKSPFYVVNEMRDWETPVGKPRRAGVSSLGVGGTNAHVILEEAPAINYQNSNKKYHFIPFSTKTSQAQKKILSNFSEFFSQSEVTIADLAYTMQNGRQQFNTRNFIIASSPEDAKKQIDTLIEDCDTTQSEIRNANKIVFMFSGQGSQYLNMGRDLYSEFSTFKTTFDTCCTLLLKHMDFDLREILFSTDAANNEKIMQTNVTQPLLFSFEYSLAKLWAEFGITPNAMIGHSIGEYVAACLSGVFTLEETLFLVAERGKIMVAQPEGKMLSISLSADKVSSLIDNTLEIALVNSPELCVVAGSQEHIERLKKILTEQKIEFRQLHTSHAFHSSLMNGAVAPFVQLFDRVKPQKPTIPFISNSSGTWITDEDTKRPSYWGEHIRNRVNFSDGINCLLNDGYTTFIEIGPGSTLSTFFNSISSKRTSNNVTAANEQAPVVVTTVRHIKREVNDVEFFLTSAGDLWKNGNAIDFNAYYADELRNRVHLPTYPFEKKRHWVEPKKRSYIGMGVRFENGSDEQGFQADSAEKDLNSDVEIETKDSMHFTESELKLLITSIWKKQLGLDSVDPDTNFFSLGGDSIIVVQILARIREKTHKQLSMDEFYKNPTISALSMLIAQTQQGSPVIPLQGPVRAESKEGIIPSNAQQRIWFLVQLEPESPAFNLATEFVINGDFNYDVAKSAIDMIVDRHDALRSTFYNTDDGPRVRIKDKVDYPFETIDLSNVTESEDEHWIKEIIKRSVAIYDLQNGPLVRILIIKLSKTRHVLTLMVHHIVADGWSMGVFLKDFSSVYSSLIDNQTVVLPELPFRYADYTNWQATQSSTSEGSGLEYWKNTLSGSLPILEMPTEMSRPKTLTYKGSSVLFSLDTSTTQKLELLARNEQTTIFNTLLGIYYLLLSRYSRQSDIIIGAPAANRNSTNVENLIGFFLNMVPLRINSEDCSNFNQLLKKLKNITQDAFAHQDVPFDVLVETLKPQRDMSHPPIFQVIFAYQNFPIETTVVGNTTIRPEMVDRGATEFDLALYMWEDDGVVRGLIEYSTDLFSQPMIKQVSDHFVNIAQAVASSADIQLSSVPILSDKDRIQIIHEWNKTDVPFPEDKCIHHLFKERVLESPNATAVIFKDKSLTYKELDIQSDKIASLLFEKGVRQGDRVGICLERHLGMVVSLLGILKCGAAYVPLDPTYPVERLQYMAEDAKLAMILIEQDVPDSFSTLNAVQKIKISPDISSLVKQHVDFSTAVSSGTTAYVIYTSGSTGKPKGVPISHHSAVNFLLSMKKEPGITSNDRMLATTTLSFDMSVFEIFLPLISGASLIMVENQLVKDGKKLVEYSSLVKPTIMQGTPSFWRLLLTAGWPGLNDVKIISGGEPITYDLIRELLPKSRELWNGYGPTETTVFATCCKITSESDPITIGKPIDNTFTYILDNFLQPVPVGVAGELFIGGVGLADEYINRPELTAEKFITDPFKSGKMYKTGDLTKYRGDGSIEYLGRIDNQVKVRGYRIELGEIENTINQINTVGQCVVIAVELQAGDVRLVAYVVPKQLMVFSSDEIRNALRNKLPEYMIPQHIIEIKTLPLTPSGKIDRKSLLVLFKETQGNVTKSAKQPQTKLHFQLQAIWESVLGVANIGINDNFFDLGGHSLLAVKLVSKITNILKINILLTDILANPTIESLAEIIQPLIGSRSLQMRSIQKLSYVVPLKPTGSRIPFFCVHGVGGNVMNYNSLLSFMDESQPFYGIQTRGLDGFSKPFESVSEMAKSYIDEIREIQPHGPYLLGGGSMGGLIAFEMAQLLIKQNEKINLLLMLDSVCPYYIREQVKHEMHQPFLKKAMHSLECRIEDKKKQFLCSYYRTFRIVLPHELRYWEIEHKYISLASSYKPKEYTGKITLFRANFAGGFTDPFRGWQPVVKGGFDCYDFKCDHRYMVENVEVNKKLNEQVIAHSQK